MTQKDALKAGAFTALWTFIALFGLSLTGWLNDVLLAASGDGGTIVYPDPAVLVKAAVSAAAAAASGLVGAVVRLAQVAGNSTSGPTYQD